ncbi:MAG TPA: hypothetical protein PKO36_01980 [Candidatus Hydrogenedentes bacterium]|nr:hypothetical protein [Candidatus Hydrogenedentota bacterium]HOV73288.1 hypothetical protein [Candidatus Hydrogenedentota bacterium]
MKKIAVAAVVLAVFGCAFVLIAQQKRTEAASGEPANKEGRTIVMVTHDMREAGTAQRTLC